MKTLVNEIERPRYWTVIARFGQAELVTRADGQTELRGGTKADSLEALEWISLFLHDAVPRHLPSQ
jgi:hypothetical protein